MPFRTSFVKIVESKHHNIVLRNNLGIKGIAEIDFAGALTAGSRWEGEADRYSLGRGQLGQSAMWAKTKIEGLEAWQDKLSP